jgi:hypothetical protein
MKVWGVRCGEWWLNCTCCVLCGRWLPRRLILILQDPQLPSLLARSQLSPFTITPPPPPYHHVTKTKTTHRTHLTPKTSKKQNFKVRVFANAIEFNFGNRHSDGNHVPFELCQAANHLGLELELELEVQRQTCNTTKKNAIYLQCVCQLLLRPLL